MKIDDLSLTMNSADEIQPSPDVSMAAKRSCSRAAVNGSARQR